MVRAHESRLLLVVGTVGHQSCEYQTKYREDESPICEVMEELISIVQDEPDRHDWQHERKHQDPKCDSFVDPSVLETVLFIIKVT